MAGVSVSCYDKQDMRSHGLAFICYLVASRLGIYGSANRSGGYTPILVCSVGRYGAALISARSRQPSRLLDDLSSRLLSSRFNLDLSTRRCATELYETGGRGSWAPPRNDGPSSGWHGGPNASVY